MNRFYVTEQISKNLARTPEGFLVCQNTAIARTGTMFYTSGEVEVEAGPDGVVRIERDPEEVFRPETLASFEGKPVTIGHPDQDVSPANWQELAVGVVTNVRRGTGIEDHLILADIVIHRQDAIDMILAEHEHDRRQELSCGYDARYETLSPGRGRQINIVGNHLALVAEGRCGPVCATKDHLAADLAPCLKNADTMAPAKCGCESSQSFTDTGETMAKPSWKDIAGRIMDAFKARDEAGLSSVLQEGSHVMEMTGSPADNEVHTHVHLHTGAPEITKPEGGLPSTGETIVSSARDDATEGNGAAFGGKTKFFSDEQREEIKESMKDSFEEFKKDVKDSMEKCVKDAVAECMKEMKGADGTTPVPTAGGPFESKVADAVEEPDKEIEGELKEEAPPGTGDAIMKAKDSAMLEDSFSQTVALAEILQPGISIPTFDAASSKETTVRAICALRRKALEGVMRTTDGAEMVTAIHGKTPDLTALACRDVAPLFRAAAATMKAKNNAAAVAVSTRDNSYFAASRTAAKTGPKTLAEMNAAASVMWGAK